MLERRLTKEQLDRIEHLESYRAMMVRKYEFEPTWEDDYLAILDAIDEQIVHVKMGWA